MRSHLRAAAGGIEALSDVLFGFASRAEFAAWLQQHPPLIAPPVSFSEVD